MNHELEFERLMALDDFAGAARVAREAVMECQCVHCLQAWKVNLRRASRLAKWSAGRFGGLIRAYRAVPE